jgi:hypothetical protein
MSPLISNMSISDSYTHSVYLYDILSMYNSLIKIILISLMVCQGSSLLMLPDNVVPKPRLFYYMLDVFAISILSALLWPIFLYSLVIRLIAALAEKDLKYLTTLFVINAELYRGYYGFLRKHLHIYPNLYSRHIFFQAGTDQPLSAGCFTLSLFKHRLQIILKVIDWD